MIKSMTGYGQASQDFANGKYLIEIKSLNSKFLELNIKLPKNYSDKEFFLRNECTRLIERGKVMLTITVENNEGAPKAATINENLFLQYYQQLKSISEKTGETNTPLIPIAVTLPEVIKYDESTISEQEWKQLLATFYTSVQNFHQFRIDEGNVLLEDLQARVILILNFLEKIEVEEPKRIIAVKERLNNFLANISGKENIDGNRLEQELIYYIDKLDITEEKVRLRSHCKYFIETLNQSDASGKKLGFITQEIGREINTIGSKANNADIQKMVVGMKEELEKIKEQLLNVL